MNQLFWLLFSNDSPGRPLSSFVSVKSAVNPFVSYGRNIFYCVPRVKFVPADSNDRVIVPVEWSTCDVTLADAGWKCK